MIRMTGKPDKICTIVCLENCVAIDESLVKFRDRLPYVQFVPSKQGRFGIKFYKLCESESEYCASFKIYTGQDKLPGTKNPAAENVITDTGKPILGIMSEVTKKRYQKKHAIKHCIFKIER